MAGAHDANFDMVDQLIARRAMSSEEVIAAFRNTPRHYFLDHVYSHSNNRWLALSPEQLDEEGIRLVYTDRAITTRLSSPKLGEVPVSISSSSQPSLMAQMLEDLDLHFGLRVLEIGSGTGYNAALLAHIVGVIVSVDVDREVLDEAQRHLAHFPDRQIRLLHGDGRQGNPSGAGLPRCCGFLIS